MLNVNDILTFELENKSCCMHKFFFSDISSEYNINLIEEKLSHILNRKYEYKNCIF